MTEDRPDFFDDLLEALLGVVCVCPHEWAHDLVEAAPGAWMLTRCGVCRCPHNGECA